MDLYQYVPYDLPHLTVVSIQPQPSSSTDSLSAGELKTLSYHANAFGKQAKGYEVFLVCFTRLTHSLTLALRASSLQPLSHMVIPTNAMQIRILSLHYSKLRIIYTILKPD